MQLLNDANFYEWAGYKAGLARRRGDEATAQHHSRHAAACIAQESSADARRFARHLFDSSYRRVATPARVAEFA